MTIIESSKSQKLSNLKLMQSQSINTYILAPNTAWNPPKDIK